MSALEDFLTSDEEQEIVEAIRKAEQHTSGEIRVHIESNCQGDILEHAMEVFHFLKMDMTKARNGVLIYVAVNRREFVIYGDRGINAKVGSSFWNSTRDLMASHFKKSQFADGLIAGIQQAGHELSAHFPWIHGDVNELDDSISKG